MIMREYFYAESAEKFAFFSIPKLLFTDSQYKNLSYGAKVLYGLMLDRMGLSLKNGWKDGQGRVFIHFRQSEIMELLQCGKEKAAKLISELQCANGGALIDIVPAKNNRPRRIYLMRFDKKSSSEDEHGTRKMPPPKKPHKQRAFDFRTPEKLHEQRAFDFRTPGRSISELPNDFIKTEKNKTEYIYPIISKDSGIAAPLVQQADMMDTIIAQVKKQIDYDEIAGFFPGDAKHIDELALIIADVYTAAQGEIMIAQQKVSAATVRARYEMLTGDHILYVIESYKKVGHPVNNPRAYLRTALYNAPTTYELATKQEVSFIQREYHRRKEAAQQAAAKAERERQIVAAMEQLDALDSDG